MSGSEQLSYTVIPDSHGQYDRVAEVIDIYETRTDKFVSLGDIIDGPDSARLIGLWRSLGDKALALCGNHEWTLRNALTENEKQQVAINVWRSSVWPGYEDRMLGSYGLSRSEDWQSNALSLREAMQGKGDLDWLNSLPAYHETADFVAIHAGPRLDQPWSTQAAWLDGASKPVRRLWEEPDQLFARELALPRDVPEEVDHRVFVSGHAHLRLPVNQRSARGRICLASELDKGDPLFVWHHRPDEASFVSAH